MNSVDLSPHYEVLLGRIKRRTHHQNDLNWLCKRPYFIPDYFTLSTFHRTRYEQFGQYICKNDTVWMRVIWPQLYHSILKVFDGVYSVYYSSSKDGDNYTNFIHALEQCFSVCDPLIRHATFTEIYLFLGDAMDEFMLITETSQLFQSSIDSHTTRTLSLYTQIQDEISSLSDVIPLLLYLSTRANWLDITNPDCEGFLRGFSDEINELLDAPDKAPELIGLGKHSAIGDIETVLAKGPFSILYFPDNHGEIVFDLLLIEALLQRGFRITLAAKSRKVLNDVTYEELSQLLQQSALSHLRLYLDNGTLSLIETGIHSAGTYAPELSKEAREAYQAAQLVIVKGQGHFQSFPRANDYRTPIVALFGVRSPLIYECCRVITNKETLLDYGSAVGLVIN